MSSTTMRLSRSSTEARWVGLNCLQKFKIRRCSALRELPDSIGRLMTGLLSDLLHLEVQMTPIRAMPALMEALTELRRLTVFGCGDSSNAYKMLACCLPSMRLLEGLDLGAKTEEDKLAIGRCLRAWPPPPPPRVFCVILFTMWTARSLAGCTGAGAAC